MLTFTGSPADKEYDMTDHWSHQGYKIHFLWSKDILFVCLTVHLYASILLADDHCCILCLAHLYWHNM